MAKVRTYLVAYVHKWKKEIWFLGSMSYATS